VAHITCQWLTVIATRGVNIQSIGQDKWQEKVNDELQNLKAKQRANWAELDIMKQDLQLQEIQETVESGSMNLDAADKGGLRPVHLAAAYNRVDVLQWLVESKNVDFDQRDFASRNVLDVARASKANETVTWLEERLLCIYTYAHSKPFVISFWSYFHAATWWCPA
jgi:ankyrin repeat protein